MVRYDSGDMQDSGVTVEALPLTVSEQRARTRGTLLVWAVASLICAGLIVFGLTRAFVWDEGFHLVAAQMIMAGKRPYLDFCFPQTPLNAYWNALWMFCFGQTWRVTHIPAVLELSGATLLLARYFLARYPDAQWRVPCALAGLLFFGANSVMVEFAPIAQAYAICIFTGMAAFVLAAEASRKPGLMLPFLAGLAAGIGVGSSLLVAPVIPVLLVWLYLKSDRAKPLAFLVGAAIPFAPVVWLFAESPRAVFFNIVQYQTLFRRADWAGDLAGTHDFDVLTSWVDCGQTLLLCGLASAAILYFRKYKRGDQRFRDEFWLAVAMAAALLLYISTAHPTFSRYYIVGLPFYAMVAAPGLMIVGGRLLSDQRRFWAAGALSALLLLSLTRTLFDDRDSATWQRYDDIANAIKKVSPPGARIFADEHVYFLLHRLPPPGLEFSYSHKVELPAKEAAFLHIIPAKELEKQVESGYYATVETCDDDKIDDWNLVDKFKQRKEISDCSVFWEFNK